ncbi:MAG: 4Fe-4S ferredoxin [Clostridia bacterium]|nr:4Fe-4S ferredoxin [Clostridia bacterium]
MLETTGIPSLEQVNSSFPSMERLMQGPVAIVECFQRIPCNPCATSCKRGAIVPFEDINDLPNIKHETCNGCSLCVFNCPGLAIMVIDYTYSETEVTFKIPYEFIPLPSEGDFVQGLDREGQYLCDVKVLKVQNTKAMDRTPVITLAVDKAYLKTFRNIKVVK